MGNTRKRMIGLTAAMCILAFLLTGAGLGAISVSSTVNEVHAGTLDVDFEMFQDEAWVNAVGETMSFVDAEGNDAGLWEPGCTYELPWMRVDNNSDLDIKYTIQISGINGDDQLNEVIEWYYVTDTAELPLAELKGTLAVGMGTEAFTIRGHMMESASNAYQGLSIDSIAVTVAVTQASNPQDPGVGVAGVPYYTINTDADLTINEGGAYIVLNDEEQNYLASVDGQKITISNATVTGHTYSFMLGQYRGTNSINYNLEANHLNVLDLNVFNGVVNGYDRMSIAVYAYGRTTLNDCVMMGTTSDAEGYGVYDVGFVNGSKCAINGGKYGSVYVWCQAHLKITDAEVDRIVCATITTRNLGMLTIAEGTHVGTIELTTGGYTRYKPALTIEDGAVVDEIIYRGVSYTQEEWLAGGIV